jgi:DNA helicase-2/ATP-dependent DNA helicase PcrA
MAKILLQERKLNKEQKAAVEFGDGPLLIIAGAGTGKTTVITERIKHLISSGRAKPQEILALTFTEKASREMEERVDLVLPYGVTQMWISTFHAFCDRILRNEGLVIGLDPNFKLMTEAVTIQFFRTHLFAFDLSYFRPLGNPTKFISGMIQHFSRLKDEDVNPEQYGDWIKDKGLKIKDKTSEEKEELEKYKELAHAYKTYEDLKTKNSVMDYGDLIAYTLKLFRTRKGILKKYQGQFKYLLIDEFQDTNFSQNELAILLAGQKKNITVVGDDDQAIYRWRGAAISNIIQFRKHFPKTAIVVLTKNYRSTKEILDRSYQMIQNNNPDRLEVVEKIDKKLECVRRINGTPIKLLYVDRVENEAEEVVQTISSFVKTSFFTKVTADRSEDKQNPYSWKDVAILVRANAHAEPFIRALSRNGIPYQFLGPGQLFRQPEVKDLICYLKVLYDINDNVSLFRVLSMDHFQIPARDIAALISHARQQGLSLFEICEIVCDRALIGNENLDASSVPTASSPLAPSLRGSEAAQNFIPSRRDIPLSLTVIGEKKIASLIKLILKHLSLLKKETAGQILYYFLEETGLLKSYTSIKTTKEEKAADNIAKFFDKLKTYEADHEDASVFAVVDWLELSMDIGESPLASNMDWNTYDAVNILTVHSAKGLEFPIVFLVNLVGARFPTTEKHEQIPIPDALVKEILPEGDYHLEEERRLFYVGMTRARDLLYLTAAKYYGEGKREKKISPFVIETLGLEASEFVQRQPIDAEKQLLLLDWTKPQEQESVRVRQPVHYLSYSQAETFKKCPLQYKYRYIIRIPVPPSSALSFGDTIHKTLYAFYEKVKQKESVDKHVLLKLYHDNWKSIGYKNKGYEEKMKQHGVFLLEEFFQKGYDPTIQVIALEQPFKIKITPQLSLGGKIDRIDKTPDGKLEIIDYKTGSALKRRDPKDDMQLSVYALAATEKGLYGEKPEHVIVSFYFLEGQEKISGARTKEQLGQVRQEIKIVAENISESTFSPTPGKHCDFCEFRLICDAWK